MTATVVTNGVGLVFWTVAARIEPASHVGHASAVVAAATLWAGIAQLNLTNVFIRLIPTSGGLGNPWIVRGYAAVAALAVVLAAIYVGSGLSGHIVTRSWLAGIGFTMAVALLAIFALQDSVLTALRLAPWVTVENVSFALAKLALLPALAIPFGTTGIVVSWLVPAGVAVAVVTWLLLRRVLPKRSGLPGNLPSRGKLMNFVAAEYVGNICSTATIQVMPILIVSRLGPSAAAYFTLPWFAAQGITFLMWNIGSSFVVELAAARDHADALARRSGAMLAAVAGIALVVCVFGAHPLLSLLGSDYAKHGTQLLRLIGLSAPFSAVVTVYSALAWLDQRVWLLAGFLALSGGVLVGSALALMPSLGLAAVGWGYLGTQGLASLVMAPLVLVRIRNGQLLRTA